MRTIAPLIALAALISVSGASADSADAGNGIFRVIVEDSAGADGLGTFTILTGADHPAGGGHEVLFADDSRSDAGSSYLSVRSYTTGTDYVQTTQGAASGNLVSMLDPYGTVEPLGGTGFRTTYSLPGTGVAPDSLRITSDVSVIGSTEEDSVVEMQTTLANEGAVPVRLGVRYLLDFAPGGDDGPYIRSAGQALPQSIEQSYGPKPTVLIVAPNSAGAAAVPVTIAAGEPASEPMVFASWHHAYPFAFDFTPAGRNIADAGGLNDSAVLAYFGATEESAIVLPPGSSFTVVLGISAATEEPVPTETPSAVTPTSSPGPQAEGTEPVELPRTGGRID